MKVYCANCKYSVGFKLCRNKQSLIYDYYSYCYGESKELNKSNDCKNYKRKWWKFWIK